METVAKAHWTLHNQTHGLPLVSFHGKQVLLHGQKIVLTLKAQLFEHTASKLVREDINIQLLDWNIIQTVVMGEMINARHWTVKFITRFCKTGCMMQYWGKCESLDCCCRQTQKLWQTSYSAPIRNLQQLWDSAICKLQEFLLNPKMQTTIAELSKGLNQWRSNYHHSKPSMEAWWCHHSLTWANFTHGFITSWILSYHQQPGLGLHMDGTPSNWSLSGDDNSGGIIGTTSSTNSSQT